MMNRLTQLGLLTLTIVAAGCGRRAYVPDTAENRTAEYEAGSPSFDMEVVSAVKGDRTGMDIYLAVPHASLVFVRHDGGYRARYDILAKVLDGREAVIEDVWSGVVETSTYDAMQTFEPALRSERIELDSGTYTVQLALEEAESGARTVRTQDVTFLDRGSLETAVSELLLEASRGSASFEQVVSLHVRAGYDSLGAVTELYNVPDPAQVSFTLVRFATDTATATPPYWFTPAPFELAYKGIDYEAVDTLQLTRRRIVDASEQVAIEFAMPRLEFGTYAAVVKDTSRTGGVKWRTGGTEPCCETYSSDEAVESDVF